MNKIVILIAAYNEQSTIKRLISKIKQYPVDIIIIDDGSIDRTCYEVISTTATLIRSKHCGKGHALKQGQLAIINRDYEYVICMDADLQHNPSDIPRFIKSIEKTNAEVIIGSRFNEKVPIPFPIKIVNLLHNGILNLYLKLNLHDYACGYRAFNKKSFSKIKWKNNGYGVEIEQIIHAKRLGLNIKELSIKPSYKSSGAKISLKKILVMTTDIHSTLYRCFSKDFRGFIFILCSMGVFLISLIILILMLLLLKIRG